MTNPTLECMHTPSCIGNLTFGHECCRLHKYRCSYIYNFFMHAFHSIFCFWLFRVQFHLSFMPCSGVHGIFHHALTRSGPSLMCFRETTVTPPDAHIGEHALTLDFRALEKILKDVCSFDFCLIHVSWCVVGNWARSCWVWSDGIELECVRFRSLHLSLQRAEKATDALMHGYAVTNGFRCAASVKNWEAILLLLHYIRCQVSLVGTTWNTLQFALIASSTIGWLHRIRRETEEEGRKREREREREYIEKAMQKGGSKKTIWVGQYTFVDLFCVSYYHVLFRLI